MTEPDGLTNDFNRAAQRTADSETGREAGELTREFNRVAPPNPPGGGTPELTHDLEPAPQPGGSGPAPTTAQPVNEALVKRVQEMQNSLTRRFNDRAANHRDSNDLGHGR